jgi:hypothetical protein
MSGDFIICDAHLTPLNAYGRSVPFGEGCRKPSLRLGHPGDHPARSACWFISWDAINTLSRSSAQPGSLKEAIQVFYQRHDTSGARYVVIKTVAGSTNGP